MNDDTPLDTLDRVALQIEDGDFDGALAALADARHADAEAAGRAHALELLCRQGLDDEAALEPLRARIAEEARDRAFALGYAAELCAMDAADQAAPVLEGLLEDETAANAHLPWFYLGLARQALGEDEAAIDAFDAALELDMGYEDAMLARGESQQLLGDLDGAAESLELYAEANPDDRTRWIDLAVCHGRRGQLEPANEAFVRAAKAPALDAEDDIALFYAWAQVARLLDDGDRLTRAIKKLMAAAPDDPRTLLARGFAADRAGVAGPGWNMFQKAFEAAAADEDLVLLHYTAECAFEFVQKHGLGEAQEELIEMVFDEGVFTEPVLGHLRRIEGADEAEATDFAVAVRGVLPPEDEEEQAEAPLPYVRWINVFASDAAEAGRLAVAFEGRAGGEKVELEAVEAGDAAGLQRLGVWWASVVREPIE